MADQFTTDLTQLRRVANEHMPNLASELGGVGLAMLPECSFIGSYAYLPEQSLELGLQGYADELVERMRFGVAAVHDTAKTLNEIADLYARADGQG
ncbi:hypothetical protein ACFQV2_10985 [Actinokineospora soli]|uniref:Excreted virulence factor EspC, type VII ESX diderm n=1 Tax=Actinokineospora soli TaxID=1048753 RepID=A0ABW2TME4_9PSEU